MKTATQTNLITVCDKCFTVACWNGAVMCSQARTAGTITDTPENISKMAYGLAPVPQETPAQQGLTVGFFSLDIHKRYEPVNHFWIEVQMDGKTFRIDFGKQEGSDRNSIHINGPVLDVNHHSLNALDVYVRP